MNAAFVAGGMHGVALANRNGLILTRLPRAPSTEGEDKNPIYA